MLDKGKGQVKIDKMVEGQKTAKQLEKEKKKAEEKAAKLEKLRLKQEKQKELEAKAKSKVKPPVEEKAAKVEKKSAIKYTGNTKPGEKKDVSGKFQIIVGVTKKNHAIYFQVLCPRPIVPSM